MDRFAILRGDPLPPLPPEPKIEAKYFYGLDINYSRDKSSIAVCHKKGDRIVFDHADIKEPGTLHEAIMWFNGLCKKYPISKGLINWTLADPVLSKLIKSGLPMHTIEKFDLLVPTSVPRGVNAMNLAWNRLAFYLKEGLVLSPNFTISNYNDNCNAITMAFSCALPIKG